jgi:hypothetical protein
MLADVVAVYPSLDPTDYTEAGSECAWYEERKASGSVVSCSFPSTTVVVIGAVGILGMLGEDLKDGRDCNRDIPSDR